MCIYASLSLYIYIYIYIYMLYVDSFASEVAQLPCWLACVTLRDGARWPIQRPEPWTRRQIVAYSNDNQ